MLYMRLAFDFRTHAASKRMEKKMATKKEQEWPYSCQTN